MTQTPFFVPMDEESPASRKTSQNTSKPPSKHRVLPDGTWVFGPYQERKGSIIQEFEIHEDRKTGKRKSVYLGIVGRVDPIHWEGDIPEDLLQDLSHAYYYAKVNRWARIRDPLGRLLKLIGARLYTDEEIP